MRFSSVIALSLAAFTAARPITASPQEIAPFKTALDSILSAVNSLSDGIGALTETSDPKVVAPALLSSSKKILDALTTGAAAISATKEPLTLVDSTGLIAPSSAMTKKVVSTIDALIAKKALIAKAGQTATVLASLKDQLAVTKTFTDAIAGKVPAMAKSIVQSQAAPANAALEKAIKEFSS